MSPRREPDLDPLYREHPDGFVKARDALAKELRAGGDKAGADDVKKLRRPSAAAWLLNRAALRDPKALKAFAAASEALEKAQRRALEGKDKGAEKWRAAAEREREASAAVLDAAEKEASEAGHPATKQALDLVDGTLRAAAADPELRETVVSGRLDRERSAATIGGLDAGTMAAADGKSGAKRSDKDDKASEKKRAVAQAKRDLKRLEHELAAAEAREAKQAERVEQASEALREQKAELAKPSARSPAAQAGARRASTGRAARRRANLVEKKGGRRPGWPRSSGRCWTRTWRPS